jgi:hypothetical protein
VRHLSSFTITSPAAVLSITRSPRRMDIEARTECQMGILSDYGGYSFEPQLMRSKLKRCNLRGVRAKSMNLKHCCA